MSEDNNQPMTDHEYDGIRELDNSLPTWWLVIFLGTIIFSFIYYIHYEFGGGALPAQELEVSLKEMQAHRHGENSYSEEKLLGLFSDEAVHAGQAVFTGRCAPCHGDHAQGVIGPNLTDKSWLHGQGSRMDILATIQKGVPEKGMPAWEGQISENELIQVAAYVHSVKGTFAKDGKPAQGTETP